MTPFERIKQDLIWQPMLAGLEVHEPETVLDTNLGWIAWDKATQAMDETAAYAVAHPEVCR